MGKKKCSSRLKQPQRLPLTPPPPPPPQTPGAVVDSVSKQADRAIDKYGTQALHASRSGDSKKALKMIRENISANQGSPHLHCVEAMIHRNLAEKLPKGSYKELKHLTNAIRSAELAVALLPNSIEYAFLLATLVRRLAMLNGKEWDKLTEVCERLLKIENPVDMLQGINPVGLSMGNFLDEMGILNKESRIEATKQEVMKYLEESRRRKNLKSIAKEAEGEEKEDTHRMKEDMMSLERRKKEIQAKIRELEQKETDYIDEKLLEIVEVAKYKRFWRSTLSSEEKRRFLKVNIEEFHRHLKSLKNNIAVEAFAEALGFAKEHKTWKFFECCVCLNKFGDPELYRSHFWGLHLKNYESIMQSLRQEEIASEWTEIIVNGVWKPVDICMAIKIIVKESVSTVDSDLGTGKAIGACKDSSALEEELQDWVGNESDGHLSSKTSTDAHKWPLSDDTERAKILERIQGIFLLLLRNRILSPRHVHYVIQYTIQKYEGIISLLDFRRHRLETPMILCFLGASQLKELLNFFETLVNLCVLSENSEMDISMGLNIKERVGLSRDFSSLLLDERSLRQELTTAIYSDPVADDGSAVTSAVDVCEDDVLLDSNEIVSWIYCCPKLGEHLKLWTRQMDSRKVGGKEVLSDIFEECLHLQTAHHRIPKLMMKMEAVQAVDDICFEEISNRKQYPEHVVEPYAILLRKRHEDLQGNDDTASRTESNIIEDVLKEASLNYDQSVSKDSSLEDVYKQTDNCIKLALQKLKMQLLENMAVIDTMILKRIDVLQKYELVLEKLSVHDYRFIILPLLKSLLQKQLEELFNQDAVKKSEVAREALLAELDAEKTINEGCDNERKKRKNKKKKKNLRKAKESKVNDSAKHYQLPQKDAEQDGNPNSQIGESAGELKQLSATEVRLFEEHLEYQRQFEHEASLKVKVLGTGRRNEEADCFVNVILQSLWNLREFREEFMSRLHSKHEHIGKPCIICTLYDIFAAISTASAENQVEVIAPTSLVIDLRNGYHDKNSFGEGQMNNASEFLQFILESLHESFTVAFSDSESDDYEGSLDCFSAGCFVHRIFGMDHFERINCVKCQVESRHRKYSSLFLHLNTYNLEMLKNKHGHCSFDVLLKLAEMNGQLTCESCGHINYIYHTLWCRPHVLTLVLGWQRVDESSEDISTTLSALSNELDLSVLFQGYQSDNIYFLIEVVCFSEDRQCYFCFIYNDKDEKYVQYDDRTLKVIGSWNDVVAICDTMHLKPQILFFIHKSSIYFGE